MKKLILVLISLTSFNIFAAEVNDLNSEYKTYQVKAIQVDGVKLYLSKEFERQDCNQISVNVNPSFAGGNMDGDSPVNWHSTYFVTASAFSTEMHCPIDEPIKETVKSRAIDIESYTNPNIDREVIVNVVIPKGYDLLVEEY